MDALERRREMQGGLGLLTICLDLHAASTGSADPLDDETGERYVAILRLALEAWTPSPPFTREFDDAARRLIEVTLQEIQS